MAQLNVLNVLHVLHHLIKHCQVQVWLFNECTVVSESLSEQLSHPDCEPLKRNSYTMKLICIAVTLLLCAGTTLKPIAAATTTAPVVPSEQPSGQTSNPTVPSEQPSGPTSNPTVPSEQPSGQTSNPTVPSEQPSGQTSNPTVPSEKPSGQTTNNPATTEAQTTSPEPVEEGDQGLSPGEIAGITIGTVAGVALIGGGIFGILKYTGKI
ncbi:hypothetical protein JOB18_017170 [Solea senegalensis]|uniref:Uncharacterized protein n=1 Tax=Solea senegalensis TaxID=28829 RepID=A0AAV6SGP0_SOLSE|nr:hypothetical protein JOB18_017170 [Solea senegalensis]